MKIKKVFFLSVDKRFINISMHCTLLDLLNKINKQRVSVIILHKINIISNSWKWLMNTVMQRHGISESLRGNREGELSGDLVEGTRGFLILAGTISFSGLLTRTFPDQKMYTQCTLWNTL